MLQENDRLIIPEEYKKMSKAELQKLTIVKFKQCIISILKDKYGMSNDNAFKAICSSWFDDALKISAHETLHMDPEQWADDIYECVKK